MRKTWSIFIAGQSLIGLLVPFIVHIQLCAQIVIREQILIDPSNPTLRPSADNPLDIPPDYFVVPPLSGTLRLEVMNAFRMNYAVPPSAYLKVVLPETTYTTTVVDFFNNFGRYYWASGVSCPYWEYYGTRYGSNPMKLLFIKVIGGRDTLRFVYHSDADIPTTYLSGSGSWAITNSRNPPPCNAGHDFRDICNSDLRYVDSLVFAGFKLKADADTILYGDATSVRTIAVDSSGNELPIDNGTLMRYVADPTTYGKFRRAAGDTVASPVDQQYSDARNGRTKYVSSASFVSDSYHTITVTVKSLQDTTKTANCKVVIGYFLFNQTDTRWKDTTYDSRPQSEKIGRWGCALSCMAMILKGWGYDMNPLTLNAWMRANKQFTDSGGVRWNAIPLFTGGNIALEAPNGKSHKYGGQPMALTELDKYMGDGSRAVVIEVPGHPTHFVRVLGKNSSGHYVILDPESTTPTTLDAYGNTYYQLIPFRKLN